MPALFVAFSGLLVALIAATTGRAGPAGRAWAGAVIGWWFGFGYFLAGLWWIGSAFLVEAERFAVLMPFAVAGLPAGLAVFPAGGAALAALVLRRGATAPLALAAGLTVSELLRQTVLTGFPWNAYGLMWTGSLALAQTASFIGVTGLTFLAVSIGSAPALVLTASRRAAIAGAALGATVVVLMAGFGALRLQPEPGGAAAGSPILIVQPAIPQAEKWLPERANAIFAELLELSVPAGGLQPGTTVIWPETALPFLYEGNLAAERAVGEMLPPGTSLLLGAVRRRDDPASASPRPLFFNAILSVHETGMVTGAYDKVHLVPFGEYLPLRPVLSAIGLDKLTEGTEDFTPGARHDFLETATGEPVAGLVCYEVIFPGIVRGLPERPRAIVNLTNDAWFGDTPGPHQHMRQARMRAIESGLPIVRAANTGISAVIDGKGRIDAMLPLGVRGAIDSRLPPADPPTAYSLIGDFGAFLLVALAFLIVLFARRRAKF